MLNPMWRLAIVVIGVGVVLSLNLVCFFVEKKDAIISNSAVVSLYIVLCLKALADTLTASERHRL